MTTSGTRTEEFKVSGANLKAKLKEILRKGTVRRVVIKNAQGRTVLDIPLAAGIVGAALLPFWAAVMAMEPAHSLELGDDLRDRAGTLPLIWFQESGSEEPRQRWHPDIWVDPAEVQPTIDAALAAGGTLVSDAEAPSFWVLADPEGNKVCLCTWQQRGA